MTVFFPRHVLPMLGVGREVKFGRGIAPEASEKATREYMLAYIGRFKIRSRAVGRVRLTWVVFLCKPLSSH